MENVIKSLSRTMTSQDTQIAIIALLCFIGGWVVITKTLQILFTIIWPLMVLAGMLMMFPIFPTGWFTENLQKYTELAVEGIRRIQEEFRLNANGR